MGWRKVWLHPWIKCICKAKSMSNHASLWSLGIWVYLTFRNPSQMNTICSTTIPAKIGQRYSYIHCMPDYWLLLEILGELAALRPPSRTCDLLLDSKGAGANKKQQQIEKEMTTKKLGLSSPAKGLLIRTKILVSPLWYNLGTFHA